MNIGIQPTGLSFPELRGMLTFIRYPAFVEVKIDGELNEYSTNRIGEGHLVNKSGKTRNNCPITDDLKQYDIDVIGELYYPPGKAGDLYKLLANNQSDQLQFAIFDILRFEGTDMKPLDFMTRREKLIEIVKPTAHVRLVPTEMVNSPAEITEYFTNTVKQGYEGIVVKNIDERYITGPCAWVKLKDKKTVDVPVVNISTNQERIDIKINKRWVGVKVVDKDKKTLNIGDIVEIEHQGQLSGGGLRHPVFKRKRLDKTP